MGNFVYCLLPNNSIAGEYPSALGTFLQAWMASPKSWPVAEHFSKRCLMFFTALSARPFDWGLYGDEVSCLIFLDEQNAEKSARNWGPLSDLMIFGYPRSRNQVWSWLMTDEVLRELSLAANGNPVDLSTMTSQFCPLMWKMSVPTENRGASIVVSAMVFVLGFELRYFWHGSQRSVICFMSFIIPCQ